MFDEFNVLVFNMSALENAETRADRLSNEINVSATNYLTLLNDYFGALVDVSKKLIQAQVHDSAIAGRINQPNANDAEKSAHQAKNIADKNDQSDKVAAFKAYHTALTQWHNTLKYIYRGDEVIIQKDLIKGQVQPLINETAMTAAESGREAAQPQVTAAKQVKNELLWTDEDMKTHNQHFQNKNWVPTMSDDWNKYAENSGKWNNATPYIPTAQTAQPAQPSVKTAARPAQKKTLERSNRVSKLMQVKPNSEFSQSRDDLDLDLDLDFNNPNRRSASKLTIRADGGKPQKTRKNVRFAEGSKLGGSKRRKGRKTRRR